MKLNPLQQWRAMPAVAKSAVAFTISTFVIRGITFITTPLFTRIMPVDQYGVVATYNSWKSILEVFALLGLTYAGVFNVGMNDYRHSRGRYVSSLLLLCNVCTIVTFVILCVLKWLFGAQFVLPWHLLVLMFLGFLFSPAQTFWVTWQRYEYKYKLATAISIGSALFSQVIAFICVVYAQPEHAASVRLWSRGLVVIACAVPIYIHLFTKGHTGYDGTIWKSTLLFALPLLPHYLAQHLMGSSDRIMLSTMISDSEAGIYSVVSAIGMITTLLWNAVNGSLTPYIYDKMNVHQYAPINSLMMRMIGIYGALCMAVTLMAPEVLHILAPHEYDGGMLAIPAIAATSFLTALYNMFATVEFYHKKSGYITSATIVSSIVNIGLNLLLIPRWGLMGAAYTTVLSYLVLIAIHYIGYRRSQSERIYSDRGILIITVLTMGSCLACTLLYNNNYVRYTIIAIILIIAFVMRNTIIRWLREVRGSKSA
ncbi:MAG: oligosaccharide flippase family protein [Bacteroidales bacterium]|nr:oligosaccharide flippase family protein [Bacteroidales bacterium]